MSIVEWEGIPKSYWPDTDKPWRVCYGFGVFKDFRLKREAKAYCKRLKATEPGDWKDVVREPFNAVKIQAD